MQRVVRIQQRDQDINKDKKDKQNKRGVASIERRLSRRIKHFPLHDSENWQGSGEFCVIFGGGQGLAKIYNGKFLRGLFWLIITGLWIGTGGTLWVGSATSLPLTRVFVRKGRKNPASVESTLQFYPPFPPL